MGSVDEIDVPVRLPLSERKCQEFTLPGAADHGNPVIKTSFDTDVPSQNRASQ